MMRILVADDEVMVRKYLERVLVNFGECDIAEDGVGAMERVAAALEEGRGYDLVLLDIMMPKLNGLEALEHIHQMMSKPGGKVGKLVLLSCLADDGEFRFSEKAHTADAYLTKPIPVDTLVKELAKLGFTSDVKGFRA